MKHDCQLHTYQGRLTHLTEEIEQYFRDFPHAGILDRQDSPMLVARRREMIKACYAWDICQPDNERHQALGDIDHAPTDKARQNKANLVHFLSRQRVLAVEPNTSQFKEIIDAAYELALMIDYYPMLRDGRPYAENGARRPNFGADGWPPFSCCTAGKPGKGCHLD